jgi:hypothetical protein
MNVRFPTMAAMRDLAPERTRRTNHNYYRTSESMAGASVNAHQIDRREIRERFIEHQRGEGASFSDLIMGGLMALAGIVAIDVLSGPADNFYRSVMWLGSLTTIWSVYSLRRRSAIYRVVRSRTPQMLVERLNAIVHFGLFAFLANTFLSQKYWAYWCAAMALHCMLLLVLGYTGRTQAFADDAASLGDLVNSIGARWGLRVIAYALVGAVIAVFAFIAPAKFSTYAKLLVVGYAFACVVIDIVIMHEQDAILDKIEELAYSALS